MKTLMVASWNGNSEITSFELLSLDSTSKSCPILPDLPTTMIPMAGYLFNGTDPIICGAVESPCSNPCYLLQKGNWSEISHLNNCRFFFSILSFNHQTKYKLITSGGTEDQEYFSTVEYFDGNKWTIDQNIKLPEALADHCMVKLNNSLLMLIGGENSEQNLTSRTWFLNTLSGNWSKGPDLKTARSWHSCNTMNWFNPRNSETEIVVVVAGGYITGIDDITASVELLFLREYDLFQNGWVEGPVLPYVNAGSSLIKYESGLIIVGGWIHRHIYQLSTPKRPWVKMTQLLKEPADYLAAFFIPDDVIMCH
jgi:hypothetical protein